MRRKKFPNLMKLIINNQIRNIILEFNQCHNLANHFCQIITRRIFLQSINIHYQKFTLIKVKDLI